MEKNQRRYFIIIAVLFVGIICAVGQYMGAFNAMYALATNPNPGHTWNQMECTTGLCVDTVNNRVGVGTTSPENKLHIVGGVDIAGDFKVGGKIIYDSSVDKWDFPDSVSTTAPLEDSNVVTKEYIDNLMDLINLYGGTNFTDPRDGNIYPLAVIGNQVWMTKNLAYLPSVSFVSDFTSEAPRYFVYNYGGTDVNAAKAITNYSTYGVLYNWEAAKTACPTGWHLPSRAEWLTLKQFYSTTSCIWNSYNPQCSPAGTALSNGGISDFNALMGGYTTVTQNAFGPPYSYAFSGVGSVASFWTNTSAGTGPFPDYFDIAYTETLENGVSTIYVSSFPEGTGRSVRCIKD